MCDGFSDGGFCGGGLKKNYLPPEAYLIEKDITGDFVSNNQSVSSDTPLDKNQYLTETDKTTNNFCYKR